MGESLFVQWLDEMRRWLASIEAVANGEGGPDRELQLEYQTDAVFDRTRDMFGLRMGGDDA